MNRRRLVTGLMALQGTLAVAGGLVFVRAYATGGASVGAAGVAVRADLLALALFAWSLAAATVAQAVRGDQESAAVSLVGIVGFVLLFYGRLEGPGTLAVGGLAVLLLAGAALVVRGVDLGAFGKQTVL